MDESGFSKQSAVHLEQLVAVEQHIPLSACQIISHFNYHPLLFNLFSFKLLHAFTRRRRIRFQCPLNHTMQYSLDGL